MTTATKERKTQRRRRPSALAAPHSPTRVSGPDGDLGLIEEKKLAEEARRRADGGDNKRAESLLDYRGSGVPLRKAKRLVKKRGGKWGEWLDENFAPRSRTLARLYMRVDRYWDELQAEAKRQGLVVFGLETADKLIRQIRRREREDARPNEGGVVDANEVKRLLPVEDFKSVRQKFADGLANEYETMVREHARLVEHARERGTDEAHEDAKKIEAAAKERALTIVKKMALDVVAGDATIADVTKGDLRRRHDQARDKLDEAPPKSNKTATEKRDRVTPDHPAEAVTPYRLQLQRMFDWAAWKKEQENGAADEKANRLLEDKIYELWTSRRSKEVAS